MKSANESFIAPILLVIIPFLVFGFSGMDKALPAAVCLSVMLLWFTEALPLPVTGLLVPVLAILTGTLSVQKAFGAFGNQILFLFMGSFFLARAMEKHGFDVRLSYFIMSSKVGNRSLAHLVALVGFIAWLFSMWISNTATVAMMVPLCLGISSTLRNAFSSSMSFERFNNRLLLTLAFSASAGGMATPVGSPPNLLALEFLSQRGYTITFVQWTLTALPLSFIMLLCVLGILHLLFKTEEVSLHDVQRDFRHRLDDLGKPSLAEKMTALCFALAVFLWIAPDLLIQLGGIKSLVVVKQRLPMGLVAILAGSLLFLLPAGDRHSPSNRVLNWKDATQIDWGTIILFGGGLCLGAVISDSGLAASVGTLLLPSQPSNLLLPFLILLLLAVFLSEFGSNTASASILIPIVLATNIVAIQEELAMIVVGVGFAASFGFMLPVSTPPNAIVFGTGKLKLKNMIRAGILFDLIGVSLIFLYIGLLVPQLF